MDDIFDFIKPWISLVVLVIVLAWLLVPSITAWVYKTQRDKARAELAMQTERAAEVQKRLETALSDAERQRKQFVDFQNWTMQHPAPKDPEALRRWLLEAGLR